ESPHSYLTQGHESYRRGWISSGTHAGKVHAGPASVPAPVPHHHLRLGPKWKLSDQPPSYVIDVQPVARVVTLHGEAHGPTARTRQHPHAVGLLPRVGRHASQRRGMPLGVPPIA